MKIPIQDGNSSSGDGLKKNKDNMDKENLSELARVTRGDMVKKPKRKRRTADKSGAGKIKNEIARLEAVIEDLTEQLKQRDAELADEKGKALLAIADADNFKKRIERQSDADAKYAVESLVKAILPVLDNLEMAKQVSETGDGGMEQLQEGVGLTYNQLVDVLKGFGVERIEVLGLPLDPETSEALQMEDSDEYEDGHVSREYMSGFKLKGKVVRPAKVVVAKNH